MPLTPLSKTPVDTQSDTQWIKNRFKTPPADRAVTHSPLYLWFDHPLGELADFRRETNGEPSGSVDKELFTSFLNPKNVFPVAVLLELVLRSVLNHQGSPISLILQIFPKKNTDFPIMYDVRYMHS